MLNVTSATVLQVKHLEEKKRKKKKVASPVLKSEHQCELLD